MEFCQVCNLPAYNSYPEQVVCQCFLVTYKNFSISLEIKSKQTNKQGTYYYTCTDTHN